MGIKHFVRRLCWKFGYDIVYFDPTSHPLARKKQLIEYYNIDTVLDIGANSGLFAQQLRSDIRYANRILSFEPLSSAFEQLKANAEGDSAWEVYNYALGAVDEQREINIAGNSYSSSLLDMLPAHLKSAPESKYIGKEVIDVRRLDSIYGNLCKSAKNVFMKVDTQGFESMVLQGAEQSLSRIDTIQLEMALVPMYDGELLFQEMCQLMTTKGYTLVSIETGFSDQASGQLLEVEGIFHRL
jgi:FkbM family methyltransferase